MRALVFAACVAVAAASVARADDALDLRLRRLESGLRCLVCQNQTLAESDADLAADLRREVRQLALAGKSDDEIRNYLVARYGDFVLYDPPLKAETWLLWFGPFALLAVGMVTWYTVGRHRRTAPPAAAPEFEREARSALGDGAPAGAAATSGNAARKPLDA
jgi:cytochrome c-type biogenesis protein CcmH